MREINTLFLQVIRAIANSHSNLAIDAKIRHLYSGNSSLQLLKEKFISEPDIISQLLDADVYGETEWKEIKRILNQHHNMITINTLLEWEIFFSAEIHLGLISLYWPSYRLLSDALINQEKNLQNELDKTEIDKKDHFDKTIKLIRSAQVVTNLNDYNDHPMVIKVNKEYKTIIDTASQFMVLQFDSFPICENESLKEIQKGIAQNLFQIIRTKAQSENPTDEDKKIFEKSIENKNQFLAIQDKEFTKKIISHCYEGLIHYFKYNDDMENLFRMQSKKELLDMSL